MKFFVLAGLFALAAAVPQASSSSSEAPTVTSYSATPQETCLAACSPDDVGCRAKCIIVPNPNSLAVNQTNTCVAACDQGDGSKEASEAFAKCEQACISSYYLTVTHIGGNPTSAGSGAASVSLTVSGGTTTTLAGGAVSVIGGVTSTATVSGSASGASSSPSGSATKGAAAGIKVGTPLVGVAGLLAAMLAL